MKTDVQVGIIGAGPAGLSAARVLQENDVSFTLFERDEAPGKTKVCGGFLPQQAIDDFRIGRIRNSKEIQTIRIRFPEQAIHSVEFDSPVGVNSSRENLGETLMRPIDNKFILHSEVQSINRSSSGLIVTYAIDDTRETLEVDLLIDASGVNPVTARSLPIRKRISNDLMGYGVQYHFLAANHKLCANDFYYGGDYSPGGYAWVFPKRNSIIVGTGGLISRIREDNMRTSDYLDHLIQKGTPASSDLDGMTIAKREAALMPLAGIVRPSFSERILLAGDAAGHCSPISGEGIHYALEAGRFAGETIVDASRKHQSSAGFLSRYEKRWMKSFGADLKWGLWLQKRILRGGSQSLGSRFLKSEKTARIIAEMLVGRRSVRNAIFAAAPRYLLSRLSR